MPPPDPSPLADPAKTLWYGSPASKWEEALPIGNGRLGAMVFGGTVRERFQLNEDTVWSGGPQDCDNPEALPALAPIRELLFAGRYAEAQQLADKTQVCKPSTRGSYGEYQTLGDLILELDGHHQVDAYRRELRLAEGVALVRYRVGTLEISRESFVSAEGQVLVTRIRASRPELRLTIALSRLARGETHAAGSDRLIMSGQLENRGERTGMKYAVELRALSRGGSIAA
ncbi:MAG TPA: glycoside hydrolase family 95 protein, partial [Polyangiaceae bacterium]